ncbi:MAG: preprotein translocase subunit YajC [Candidatus Eisenbacteria bacterium]|uniref:Preprotein translocase subunit YajC n=1 Tax=Eiseniibacteriota bacterium TaxID=2212470 RepID=A0A7Y2H1C5_UNCEI|nr:preprotein translocase subunit YajC [Candidatus Eisenbacteria bacterium]
MMSPGAGGEGGAGGSLGIYVLMWGIILAIFYFLVIRPQKRKQEKAGQMIEALKRGDRVLTMSGIYGSVVGIKDNVVVLKIADSVKVEMAKSAITQVVEKSREA